MAPTDSRDNKSRFLGNAEYGEESITAVTSWKLTSSAAGAAEVKIKVMYELSELR
jgi:hypothetical protein